MNGDGEHSLLLVKITPLDINDHLLLLAVSQRLDVLGVFDIGAVGPCAEDGTDERVWILVRVC